MMKKKYILVILLSVLIIVTVYLVALNRYQIRMSDFSHVPYNGHEILYFSNGKDSFTMQLDGIETEWKYFWINGKGIKYHLVGKGLSFQGDGIICGFFANHRQRGNMYFHGKFDQLLFYFEFVPADLSHYEKVILKESIEHMNDVYKIPTPYDTTFFKDVVKTMYWSPEKGIMGLEFMGIEKPYLLNKVDYHFED